MAAIPARRFTIALLAALIAIVASAGSAFAAPSAAKQPPHTPPTHNPSAPLTKAFRAEQQLLKLQDMRLKAAAEFAARAEKLAASLKAKGKDTAALEAAVASYRAALERARAEWQAAAATLAAHAGFGDDGKVTNAEQARATLKDARGHMQQARKVVHESFVGLRKALADTRKANRAAPVLPEPQEP